MGAVKWTGTALEPYSSRGPRRSREAGLVGPTYVTSNRSGPGTAGTSAATAHVAGAAALLRQERLAAGSAGGARPTCGRPSGRGARTSARPGPDAALRRGHGAARRGRPRAVGADRPGGAGSVRVRAVDEGTIREVRISINGRALRVVRRPVVGVRLPALRAGANRVTVTAEDMAGNVAVRTRVVRGAR